MNVVETEKLTKYYGKSRGIIDVDLQIKKGEIFGFIGPNGAGKSTTIRILLSLIHESSGNAKIFGMDHEKNKKEILEKTGYLPSEVFYYDKMRAGDLFKYSSGFYKKDCKEKIDYLVKELGVDLNKRIEDMSLGNKKKVGIIQGLMHSPELIILDEPTSGLDPLMQKKFFDIIKEENKKGATVLFSSHILGEVQNICDRVAIIKEGQIIKTERISDLKKNTYKKVRVLFNENNEAESFTVSGGTSYVQNNGEIEFIFKGDLNQLVKKISEYNVVDLDISEPELEEIFIHYYSGGEE